VFDSVAGNYDLMNDAMSLGIHRVWKSMVMAKLNPQPGEFHLDVAGGTGDLARGFIKAAEEVRLSRVCGDAQNLPFPDNYFDVVTIAFGIRNVTDRDMALREFYRVLKPGGRLGVLEFSTPPTQWLRKFYDAYSFAVIPPMGQLLAKDRESYQYLVESIRRFPRQAQFAAMVKTAGFARVKWDDYSGGIALVILISNRNFHASDDLSSLSKPYHILIIEDNEGDEDLLRLAFEDSYLKDNYSFAHDGEQALDYLFKLGDATQR